MNPPWVKLLSVNSLVVQGLSAQCQLVSLLLYKGVKRSQYNNHNLQLLYMFTGITADCRLTSLCFAGPALTYMIARFNAMNLLSSGLLQI